MYIRVSSLQWQDAGRRFKLFSICEIPLAKKAAPALRVVSDTVGTSTTIADAESSTPPVVTSVSGPDPTVCPQGSTTFKDHCYLFEMGEVTFEQADEECARQGAYLVSVNTQAEQDVLVTQIKKSYNTRYIDNYWIGMTVVSNKNMWYDGTEVDFSVWGYGNPDCMDTICRAFISEYHDYKWEDANRIYQYFSICEIPLIKTEAPALRASFARAATLTTIASTESTAPALTGTKMAVSDCPNGFTEFDDQCYLFIMFKTSWYQAKKQCRRRGAYLVSVNTQTEQNFLVTQIRNNYTTSGDDYYWIGLSMKLGKIKWDDGTDAVYSYWSSGEPNSYCLRSRCVGAISEYSNYHWKVLQSRSRRRQFYICEREISR